MRFNGILYRRYPQAKNFSDRNYFRCKIADKKKGFGFLHRDIWKFHHGEIPEGFHIHHRDENALNNHIDNLEALHPKEHGRKHKLTPNKKRAIAYRKTRLYALEKARKAAVNWHRSDEGREWHRKHAKKLIAERKKIIKICEFCNNKYQTISISSKDRFCSEKCKSSWRRNSGLDNENRNCEFCKKVFTTNKYTSQKFCSLSCVANKRWSISRQNSELLN